MFPAPRLDLDDLGEVLEEVLASSTKWYKIGLRLKVPVDKLDGIRNRFSDPGDHLCEMLKEWLKGVAAHRPTWAALVEALRSQLVGEPKLADQLEAKHCQSERKSQGNLLSASSNCWERVFGRGGGGGGEGYGVEAERGGGGELEGKGGGGEWKGRVVEGGGGCSINRFTTWIGCVNVAINFDRNFYAIEFSLVDHIFRPNNHGMLNNYMPPCLNPYSIIGSCCTALESSLLNKLKTKVEYLKGAKCSSKQEEESKVDMIKVAVREYVTEFQQSGSTKEHVEGHLQRRSDFLLSEPIYKWSLQLVAETFEKTAVDKLSSEPLSPSEPSEPLFCKDTVYHASICSRTINDSDAGDYLKFLKAEFPGHSFQAVSISRTKQDRYLIARQGESTYYFAFQSEPDLSKWPQLFKSFSEGKQPHID